jgi:hypothetical protein
MQQLELRADLEKSLKEEAEKIARKLRESEEKMEKLKANHIREIAKL